MDYHSHTATGCPVFDIDHGSDVSCPGLPEGRIVLVEGEETTGKTTLALIAAAAVIRAGLSVVYIDLTAGLTPDQAEFQGISVEDSDRFVYYAAESQKQGIQIILHVLRAVSVGLVVLDGMNSGFRWLSPEERAKCHHLWAHALPQIRAALGTATLLGLSWPGVGGTSWRYLSARRVLLEQRLHPVIRYTVTKDILDSIGHPTTGVFALPVPEGFQPGPGRVVSGRWENQ